MPRFPTNATLYIFCKKKFAICIFCDPFFTFLPFFFDYGLSAKRSKNVSWRLVSNVWNWNFCVHVFFFLSIQKKKSSYIYVREEQAYCESSTKMKSTMCKWQTEKMCMKKITTNISYIECMFLRRLLEFDEKVLLLLQPLRKIKNNTGQFYKLLKKFNFLQKKFGVKILEIFS